MTLSAIRGQIFTYSSNQAVSLQLSLLAVLSRSESCKCFFVNRICTVFILQKFYLKNVNFNFFNYKIYMVCVLELRTLEPVP